jgi:putative thioredoxin
MSEPRPSPSIFTRGAVDLGALRPTPSSSSPSSPSPSPSASTAGPVGNGGAPAGPGPGAGPGGVTVIDVTEATFQSEVLERSLQTPVVMDLWAEWCQPCKQLSPVLEKLAIEGGGAWVLAKIDIDANPRLAQALRVQSIPMVIAVVGGQMVDAFAGVQPEAQLRQWIAAIMRAGGGDVAPPEDPRLEAADEALMNSDFDAAEQAYKKILADAPADRAAEAGLAQVGLFRRISGVDPARVVAEAGAAPDDVAKQLLAADVEVATGAADRAYQRLVDLIRRTAGDDRETVRKHLVSLFTIAGPDDPAVAGARRALASALF